jgi:hypothetical protein
MRLRNQKVRRGNDCPVIRGKVQVKAQGNDVLKNSQTVTVIF